LIYVEEVTKLAYILGRREEARVFIEFYDGFMNTIEERVSDIPEEDKTKVYLEAHHKYVAVGTGSGRHAMIVTAGGKNIFDDLSGTFDIDAEEVVRLDPQVIIKTDWSVGGFETDDVTGISATRDEIMGRKELADVTAVKDKRVYVVSDKFPGGVEFFVGTGNYAKWLHPALFEDFDPMEYLQEYLTTFQQLDFDVSEHGVLVYHPEQHPDGH
jgi:iron complex transport system substrate-binding protein